MERDTRPSRFPSDNMANQAGVLRGVWPSEFQVCRFAGYTLFGARLFTEIQVPYLETHPLLRPPRKPRSGIQSTHHDGTSSGGLPFLTTRSSPFRTTYLAVPWHDHPLGLQDLFSVIADSLAQEVLGAQT